MGAGDTQISMSVTVAMLVVMDVRNLPDKGASTDSNSHSGFGVVVVQQAHQPGAFDREAGRQPFGISFLSIGQQAKLFRPAVVSHPDEKFWSFHGNVASRFTVQQEDDYCTCLIIVQEFSMKFLIAKLDEGAAARSFCRMVMLVLLAANRYRDHAEKKKNPKCRFKGTKFPSGTTNHRSTFPKRWTEN